MAALSVWQHYLHQECPAGLNELTGYCLALVVDTSLPGALDIGQCVLHEVQVPALICRLRDRHRRPRAAPSRSERPMSVNPVQLLVAHLRCLALQQNVQAPVAEPEAQSRQGS